MSYEIKALKQHTTRKSASFCIIMALDWCSIVTISLESGDCFPSFQSWRLVCSNSPIKRRITRNNNFYYCVCPGAFSYILSPSSIKIGRAMDRMPCGQMHTRKGAAKWDISQYLSHPVNEVIRRSSIRIYGSYRRCWTSEEHALTEVKYTHNCFI